MNIFDSFPKKRGELPLVFQRIYSEHYKKNREGQTRASFLAQKMEQWMHKKVANDVIKKSNLATLEIGAGTLNQLRYENTVPYDVVEPYAELYINSCYLNKVRSIYKNIDEIKGNCIYDRITSIATFEHILDLPDVVAKACCLLKTAGSFRVAIPNEGSWLWTLGWECTTGIEFKLKYNLNYGILMKHEHVNTADEIEGILKYLFRDVKASVFGFSRRLAFYRFYECKTPILEHARKIIDRIP
jgi:hypothetical protein